MVNWFIGSLGQLAHWVNWFAGSTGQHTGVNWGGQLVNWVDWLTGWVNWSTGQLGQLVNRVNWVNWSATCWVNWLSLSVAGVNWFIRWWFIGGGGVEWILGAGKSAGKAGGLVRGGRQG